MARTTKTPGVRSGSVRLPGGMGAFRALPKAKGRRPAVILLHERYGVVRHTKDLALKLAQAGFAALAPDLFFRFGGDRTALERGDLRVEIRDDEAVQDLGGAMDYLAGLDSVDPARIGVMGVCQTGRHAALLAAHRKDLAASVVFYGAAGEKEWGTDEYKTEPLERLVERVVCPVLGVFGEGDHLISVDHVLKFRGLLEQRKKSYQIRIYRDAPHGWLNDTMPGRYRPEAARDAWKLLLVFLKEAFGGGWSGERTIWRFDGDVSAGYDFAKNVRQE